MLVTGLPSMTDGMISSPDTLVLQRVIVTTSLSITYFKLGFSTDTASGGLVSLLFSPSHPMRRLKAKSEIKCFMLITSY